MPRCIETKHLEAYAAGYEVVDPKHVQDMARELLSARKALASLRYTLNSSIDEQKVLSSEPVGYFPPVEDVPEGMVRMNDGISEYEPKEWLESFD